MGEACSRIPIPAVTFMHRTIHKQPELQGRESRIDFDIMGGDQSLRLGGSHPAFRLPSRLRHPDGKDAKHHGDKVDRAHDQESLLDAQIVIRAEVVHEVSGQRSAYERASAKAHDRHSCRHARAIREPLDQRRNRRNVANPQANAANHAIAKIDEPELMDLHADSGNKEAAAKQMAEANMALRGPARSSQLPNTAADKPRKTMARLNIQPRSVNFQSRAFGLSTPGRAFSPPPQRGNLNQVIQRLFKHAESISLANGQVDGKRGGRHKPAAESWFCYGVTAIQKR